MAKKYLGEAGTQALIDNIKENQSSISGNTLIIDLDQDDLDFNIYPDDNHALSDETAQRILADINLLGGVNNIKDIIIRVLFTQDFDGESISVKYITYSTTIMLQRFSDDYFFLNAIFFNGNDESFIFGLTVAPGIDPHVVIQKYSFT